MSLDVVIQLSSARVAMSTNASPGLVGTNTSSKRVAEVVGAFVGLRESQGCKESCPDRPQRVLSVSGGRSSALVGPRRHECKRVAGTRAAPLTPCSALLASRSPTMICSQLWARILQHLA